MRVLITGGGHLAAPHRSRTAIVLNGGRLADGHAAGEFLLDLRPHDARPGGAELHRRLPWLRTQDLACSNQDAQDFAIDRGP